MRERLIELIVVAARELAESEDVEVPDDLDSDTRLFGQDGSFDSMGLVSLVVAVEQAIDDEFGRIVALADDKALSQKSSPYRTIGTLADYALSQLEQSGG